MGEYIPGELAYHGQGYEEAYEGRRVDQEEDRYENERFERLSEYHKPDYEGEEEEDDR